MSFKKNFCLTLTGLFTSIILGYLFLPNLYEIHITPSQILNSSHTYQPLTEFEGAPEDVVIYKDIFLLSVRDTMTMWFKGINNVKDGGIYCLYPPYDKKQLKKVEFVGFPKNVRFLPFGMKLVNNKLYVINQATDNERIEIFTITQTESLHVTLTYQNSYLLPSYFKGKTNNLAITSPTTFYITTFKPTNFDLINQLSSHILFLKSTHLYFCKAKDQKNQEVQCSQVEDSRADSEFNNGLEIDQYGRLYVVQLVSKRIAVFQLDTKNNDHKNIQFLRYIYVEGFPDNINYDPANDSFYIGCTSKLGEFFKVAAAINIQGGITDDFTLWGTIITMKNDPDVNKLEPKIMLRQNNMIRGISAIAKIDNYYLAGTIIENRALLIKEN